VVTGDQAASADLDVMEVPSPHLVVQQVAGQRPATSDPRLILPSPMTTAPVSEPCMACPPGTSLRRPASLASDHSGHAEQREPACHLHEAAAHREDPVDVQSGTNSTTARTDQPPSEFASLPKEPPVPPREADRTPRPVIGQGSIIRTCLGTVALFDYDFEDINMSDIATI
jgi:hypothetical protein